MTIRDALYEVRTALLLLAVSLTALAAAIFLSYQQPSGSDIHVQHFEGPAGIGYWWAAALVTRRARWARPDTR